MINCVINAYLKRLNFHSQLNIAVVYLSNVWLKSKFGVNFVFQQIINGIMIVIVSGHRFLQNVEVSSEYSRVSVPSTRVLNSRNFDIPSAYDKYTIHCKSKKNSHFHFFLWKLNIIFINGIFCCFVPNNIILYINLKLTIFCFAQFPVSWNCET